jgi:hypothetical protein
VTGRDFVGKDGILGLFGMGRGMGEKRMAREKRFAREEEELKRETGEKGGRR